MACTVNTPSVTLATAGGVLSATANISAPAATIAPNPLSILSDGLFVDGSDGWLALPTTLAYSSTTSSGDAACFVVTSSVDVRAFLSPGMKVMLIHGGVTKFFIVVAVAAGTITLWAGSVYTLSAGAITVPSFSPADLPAGFPDLPTTQPPVVAYEGMTITMIADGTNGVEWTLKFRSAEATYKWRCVGGDPLFAEVTANENLVSTVAYSALTGTAGPSITVARAGDYMVGIGCRPNNATDNVQQFMSYDIGGTGAVDADSISVLANTGAASISRTRRKNAIAAATALVSKYKGNFGTGMNFENRWMTVIPVRII